MIFATVGSMFPFERFVQIFDHWASSRPGEETLIQIGEGKYLPKNTRWVRRVDSEEFDSEITKASLIVAHAGVGTVLKAFENAKPIVIVPRYAKYKEHTTDHQVHTAEWLSTKPGIIVCAENDDLGLKIDQARSIKPSAENFAKTASSAFLNTIREAIVAAL